MIVVTGLAASATAYLITRIGFFYRSRAHHRAPRIALDNFLPGPTPSVTVLVPSYQEDERDHPHHAADRGAAGVPRPAGRAADRRPAAAEDPGRPRPAARAPGRCRPRSRPSSPCPYARVQAAYERFEQCPDRARPARHHRRRTCATSPPSTGSPPAGCYGLGRRQEIVDHTDAFFVEHILNALGRRSRHDRRGAGGRRRRRSAALPAGPAASSCTAGCSPSSTPPDQLRAQAVRLVVAASRTRR